MATICTLVQATRLVRMLRDQYGLGSPYVNQYEVSRTLKWYVSPRDSGLLAALSRMGIPYRIILNKRWPKRTPSQVRNSTYNGQGSIPTLRMGGSLIATVPRDFRVRDVAKPHRPKKKQPPSKIRCPCCRSWVSRTRELHWVD